MIMGDLHLGQGELKRRLAQVDSGQVAPVPLDEVRRQGREAVVEIEKMPTLEELLRDVTQQNLHCEWPTGSAVGKETW
jgi:hypothetical protein